MCQGGMIIVFAFFQYNWHNILTSKQMRAILLTDIVRQMRTLLKHFYGFDGVQSLGLPRSRLIYYNYNEVLYNAAKTSL